MISFIVCVSNNFIYEKFLLASFKRTNEWLEENNYPPAEIAPQYGFYGKSVSALASLRRTNEWLKESHPPAEILPQYGFPSITASYNAGLRKAKHRIKIFIHQDIDLINNDWIPKLIETLKDEKVGVVGLIGTSRVPELCKDPGKRFWWHPTSDHTFGKTYFGSKRLDWQFKKHTADSPPLECIDGSFMATTKNILFDEGIKEFHFYDMDYCRTLLKRGEKIAIIDHQSWHLGNELTLEELTKKTEKEFTYFYNKWES